MSRTFLLSAVLMAVAAGDVSAAGTGSIAGTVQTTAGEPVRGAVTLHDLSTPRVAGQTPFDRQFASKSDGTFAIPEVPAGKYEICVDAPQKAVLDPCLWPGSAQTVTVVEGAAVAGVAVTVETGAVLHVRVNDREGLLGRKRAPALGKALSLAVVTPANRYLHLRPLSSDATGEDHFIVVPFEQSVTLAVRSSAHTLSDRNFKRFSGNERQIPVRVALGSVPDVVVVNVEK